MMSAATRPRAAWRDRLYAIIFGHDTPAGRAFDVALIGAILGSILVVLLDSVAGLRADYGRHFRAAEWGFTVLFTLEFGLRMVCAPKPLRYARSFFGIIDILAVLPTYVSIFVPGGQYLVVIRVLRVLRVFRVLKMVRYVGEGNVLAAALRQARTKIVIFIFTVMTIVVIVGALIYLIEGPASGFDSIPRAMYWAIVTLTTVGYGDIAPKTAIGQAMASIVMILGYGIIAVPTGIITVELAQASRASSLRVCPGCQLTGHEPDALHCRRCGVSIAGAPLL